MRFLAPSLAAGLLGALFVLATEAAAFAQPAPTAAAAAATEGKTLFLVRDPEGVTPIRAVSYQVQGGVVILVNESGGRAVVQAHTVVGRLPWASDAEIADGTADLEKLAQVYENYALRAPVARKFLNAEAERFRKILRQRAEERAAKEKAAADQLAAVTSAVYDPAAGYTAEVLAALLKRADDLLAATPADADAITKWAAPFREHLSRLQAGDRYENGAWITKAEIEHRAQAAREAAFLRGIDYRISTEVLPARVVCGLVFQAVGLAVGGGIAGFVLVVLFRRRRLLRGIGIALIALSPLALAGVFFLATRNPGLLPAASAKDDSPTLVAALADAAGLTPDPPATRTITEDAANFFVARHVDLAPPAAADPWIATREAIAVRLTPGQLSLFDLVRCAGLSWIVRYDLAFPEKPGDAPAMKGVKIGALDCPPALAAALWKSLEPSLASILTATRLLDHFTPQKPSLAALQLVSKTAPPPAPVEPTGPPAPADSLNAVATPATPATDAPPPDGGYSAAASDTWVATDGLGRALPTAEQAGPPKPGKTVGIFYYLWHGQHDKSAFDISRVLEKSPNAIHDWNDPAWGAPGGFHYWSEPLWGYYRADDEWVIRKNAQLLVDAGVDVVFFDVTNAFRYAEIYQKICGVYAALRAEGNRTPQIGFLTWSKSGEVTQALYDEFYAKNLHPDLWFRWEGKPLILAKPDELSAALKEFFTIRESRAGKPGAGKWPWLEDSPQQGGQSPDGRLEQVAVAVASHPNNNLGRSAVDGKEPPVEARQSGEGRRFAEQWKRALALDPPFLFVTQWNEWVAQRYKYDGPGQEYAGRPLKAGEPWFVDDYDPEFSRDLEPMKGGYEDNYYYQLAANVRLFKGAHPLPVSAGPQTIKTADDWTTVEPVYRDDRGDTFHRDSPGADPSITYKNDWGRNDIVSARVAADADNLYFLAETAAPLTAPAENEADSDAAAIPTPAAEPSPTPSDPKTSSGKPAYFGSEQGIPTDHWMQLLIDADKNPATGWFGYDYVVNRLPAENEGAVIERYDAGKKAWTRVGFATVQKNATHLALTLPRPLLPETGGKPLVFDFKWADNVPLEEMKSPAEFSLYGDVAPNARFNYRFIQN